MDKRQLGRTGPQVSEVGADTIRRAAAPSCR